MADPESGHKSENWWGRYQKLERTEENKIVTKVFALVSLQLLITAAWSTAVYLSPTLQLVALIAFIPAIILMFSVLIMLYCCDLKEAFPLNFFLLALFTLGVADLVSLAILAYDPTTIISAMGITLAVTVGICSYLLVTKQDFDFLGPGLFAGLLILILLPIVFWFLPPSNLIMAAVSVFGIIIFIGFILYDVSRLVRDKYQEQIGGDYVYILAAIDLYLDIVNLFLYILAFLGRGNRK